MRENDKNRGSIAFNMIFVIVGIGLIAMAVFLYLKSSAFKRKAVEVPATISRIESYTTTRSSKHGRRTKTNYNVYVTYDFDGVTYENIPLGSYTSNMYEGAVITILCDPDNPVDIDNKGMLYFPVILLSIMGVLFGAGGIIPIVISGKKKSKKENLMRNGRAVYAIVNEVGENPAYAVNGRHPYKIKCTYTDESTFQKYEFVSGNIWDNNVELDFPVGSSIRVYVDVNDYSKYYVDSDNKAGVSF
ncbi:DUF3592 domain-containing protein [Lachnospiraceae bacterium HCP1S3_C3]